MASTGEPFGLFWNDDNGDRTYNADSLERWLKKFFTSGVFNGDLQVQASSGMTLEIGSGYANTDGKVRFWNAPFNITLDAANSTYPRIDTIVITRDNVNREILCEKVTGQYSADTPQPTAPVRNSEIFQLVIAQIYIPVGATEITQSNITDTRPDPGLCGYITGTVTEMDFSQFSAQFAAYYNEFVRGHEADFDNWEATQQAAYAAWYAEVVEQMQDDHEAFNEWFENLQNQLDTDQLTHLQAQIDDIYTMLPAGSHITVTTEETTLHSMDVTISDGEHTITSEFDNNGVAIFKTLPYVGNFIIASTDGNDTAHTTVTIPYYGRYAYEIAFWNAYVDIDGGEALAGANVIVTNSEDVEVATVTLNAQGLGTFNAKEPDYYTFTAEYTGGVAIAELDVQEQMHYSLTMYAGWKTWVELGGLSPSSYETLEDVFDDEVAVRRLMTIHASADYLIAMASADITILDDFVANDTAMKWIGLRDYVCDGLTNIAGVEAMFMASDYWERYLKDHVPTMTSNSAPHGGVIASGQYTDTDYAAYHALDSDTSKFWASKANQTASTQYIGYLFAMPVCVKRLSVLFKPTQSIQANAISFKVQGTNDTSNWIDLKNVSLTQAQANELTTIEIENNNYYKYYRLTNFSGYVYTSGTSSFIAANALQFYGRALNVSVPIMTSNTAPYGEASASGIWDSNYQPWKAFDGTNADRNDCWHGAENATDNWIQYEFPRKMCIKKLFIANRNVSGTVTTLTGTLQGSNDGVNFDTLGEYTWQSTQALQSYFNVDNTTPYKIYRLRRGSGNVSVGLLNFYGVDYTEREFETGSTVKYLYDHGVELEPIVKTKGSSTASYATSEDSQMYIPPLSGTNSNLNNFSMFGANVDVSQYNLLRSVIGDKVYAAQAFSGSLSAWTSVPTDGGTYSDNNRLAQIVLNVPLISPDNDYTLNVSSIDSNVYVGMGAFYVNGRGISVKELWLE